MAKKQFFILIDTETTLTDKVADFGAVVCDRKGTIYHQCGILVSEVFGVDPLFHNTDSNGIWARGNLEKRMANYRAMVNTGSRMLASVNAINRWLDKVIAQYNPELTAYNLAFDASKCKNTGIDLNGFSNRFCLWAAAVGNICNTKTYKQFVLQNHLFNAPTQKGNMTYSTTAEAVCGYIKGQMTDEPHTSVEDIIDYEIPILVPILKKRNWREKVIAYDWNKHQVREHFEAK